MDLKRLMSVKPNALEAVSAVPEQRAEPSANRPRRIRGPGDLVVTIKRFVEQKRTDVEIRTALNIDRKTWFRWQLEHEDFRKACARTPEQLDDLVEQALCKLTTGFNLQVIDVATARGSREPILRRTIRQVPPSLSAAKVFLFNENPEKWAEHPKALPEVIPPTDPIELALTRCRKASMVVIENNARDGGPPLYPAPAS
jgi:hypothetical protein